MSDFIQGLRLGGLFFLEAVKPVLDAGFPDLQFSAALIGTGSEILGFDDEISTDHHWGPRVMLFLTDEDCKHYGEAIDKAMRNELPLKCRGYSTNFTPPNPADNNVQQLRDIDCGPVNHRVEIHTIRGFFLGDLDFDIEKSIEPADWLTFPSQKLRSITAGEVYHDGIGLQAARARFNYYPHDVWLYLLASGWNRIGQEEHLMGRAGMVGDEIGSAIIGSRLVRDAMRLCFLMERQYAPYAKWFGKTFKELKCAENLAPILRKVMLAEAWQEREQHLGAAYEYIAEMHNQLGITETLPAKVSRFFGRPFLVMNTGGGFAEAIRARITDPVVARLELIGSIDQISDNTDILSDQRWRMTLRRLYE